MESFPSIDTVGRMLPSSRKQIERMGKGKRLKKLRRNAGKSFSDKFSEAFARNFQKELKNSELWDEMVAQYGEKRALELIRKCKAEVKTDLELK